MTSSFGVNLDRRIKVMSIAINRDANNNPIEVQTELGEFWTEKRDIKDSERLVAQQQNATITTRFLVRYSTTTKLIDPSHVLEFEGAKYDIRGVKELGRRKLLEITAASRVS